eukprot:CAMPEP_0178484630 /NCGR_PEP_ID=MMETSP0696-20121128/7853_1 /TAXON_ID=265572 /ORGANISM="Extubocellulus spinifer, Strain CCMP396" /LENGTH=48 /DNA_ID= /DNA_START= /DNA_END= /DNA_ORIENTATION=
MLNGISTRAEPSLTANWAGYVARTMDLHVHVELVLAVEVAEALVALVR